MSNKISERLAKFWQFPETAPKDGTPIIIDAGYPYPLVGVWNRIEGRWICAELNSDMFNGEWEDAYFENESYETIRRWMPLPKINGIHKIKGKNDASS